MESQGQKRGHNHLFLSQVEVSVVCQVQYVESQGQKRGHNHLLLSQVSISVTYQVQYVESQGQKCCAQQIPDSSEVRNGHIVRVVAQTPDEVDHPLRYVQQQYHLHKHKTVFTLSYTVVSLAHHKGM